jgi:hypothetical protein
LFGDVLSAQPVNGKHRCNDGLVDGLLGHGVVANVQLVQDWTVLCGSLPENSKIQFIRMEKKKETIEIIFFITIEKNCDFIQERKNKNETIIIQINYLPLAAKLNELRDFIDFVSNEIGCQKLRQPNQLHALKTDIAQNQNFAVNESVERIQEFSFGVFVHLHRLIDSDTDDCRRILHRSNLLNRYNFFLDIAYITHTRLINSNN